MESNYQQQTQFKSFGYGNVGVARALIFLGFILSLDLHMINTECLYQLIGTNKFILFYVYKTYTYTKHIKAIKFKTTI